MNIFFYREEQNMQLENSAQQQAVIQLPIEPAPMHVVSEKAISLLTVIPISSPLNKPANQYFKRAFDICSCIFFLIPFFLLLPVIALMIKLGSAGPVFFLQKRNKKYGGVFTCIKFRTMTTCIDDGVHAKSSQRITSFGLFLRNSHLDELPQLINVLRGDMSLVGPRPHMLQDGELFSSIVDNYMDRHAVKPGITGLAQVAGYVGPVLEATDIYQRVKTDLLYIQNWSPMLDIKIIFRSLFLVTSVKKKNIKPVFTSSNDF